MMSYIIPKAYLYVSEPSRQRWSSCIPAIGNTEGATILQREETLFVIGLLFHSMRVNYVIP